MEPLTASETWEATCGSDTPALREALASAEREAASLQRTAEKILALAQKSIKASEAATLARKELGDALAAAGSEAFAHADLGIAAATEASAEGSTPILNASSLAEIFSQMEVAESMQCRQVTSLLIEPLTAMLEDPRGLASLPRLSSTYSSLSHDFYESLNEFLALEDDRSAMAVRAHAKTTAKATAQAGAAALSAAKSRLGAGISIFGKKLNAQFGKSFEELSSAVIGDTGAPPPPPPPADAAPPAVGGAEGRSFSASTDDAASSSGDSQANPSSMADLRSGSATLHDTQMAVLRHQLGLLKTRHTLQARLLETRRAARIALARTLVDYFYANFASTLQEQKILERHELSIRAMQSQAEMAGQGLEDVRAQIREAVVPLKALVESLSMPPAEIAVPRALLPAFTSLLLAGADAPAAVAPSEAAVKEGILFVQQGLLRQWKRCWCVIANGTLTIHRLPSRHTAGEDLSAKKEKLKVAELQLVLCNVKPIRRGTGFHLEVRSPNELIQLQALSQRTMTDWADAINAAVAAAFGAAPSAPGRKTTNRSPALEEFLSGGLKCADCGAAAPEWVSINLCVVICLECAGCHRSLGVHVSKVRSLVLDSMDEPLVHLISHMHTATLPPPVPAADGAANVPPPAGPNGERARTSDLGRA